VERIKLLYHQSSAPEQRLVHVQQLSACAESIGAKETMAELIPLLHSLSEDVEVGVRETLAEQIPRLSKVLLAEPELSYMWESDEDGIEPLAVTAYGIVIEHLVPLLMSVLSGSGEVALSCADHHLVDAASHALVQMASLIDAADVRAALVEPLLQLAHSDAEEQRVVATQLVGLYAPVLSHELSTHHLLPELVTLANDPTFRVRKAAALQVGKLSTAVGEAPTLYTLLPVFETLARDEIWGVRKATLESIANVAAMLPVDVRVNR
jgi:serine/threonine-protein phosphatase 4 regulatory subunit 1